MLLNQPPGTPFCGQQIPILFEQMEPRPLVIIHVQSVARNGGRFITEIKNPFINPISIPKRSATRIPSPVGHPFCTMRYPPASE